MKAAVLLFVLNFVVATSSAVTSFPPAPAQSLSGRLTDALIHDPADSAREPAVASQLHGTSRMVLRRKDSLTNAVFAAAASSAAIVGIAFVILQCFRAIGKASNTRYSFRRLAGDDSDDTEDTDDEEKNCGVSKSECVVYSLKN
ncbi:hypothetical protein Emed_000497 [Eimeria media]